MKVHWTPAAQADRDGIVRYIARDNLTAAMGIAERLYEAARGLEIFPNRGRIGMHESTRELVVIGSPFLLIYRVDRDRVEILRVIHGAREWP